MTAERKVEQCQHYGSRRGQFMGTTTNETTRCQERGDNFWHDALGDAYCPRHAKSRRQPPMRIEILHTREADGGCEVDVYIDGQPVRDDVTVQDVDPGRGYPLEDWQETTAFIEADPTLSDAFKAAVLAARDAEEEDSEFIERPHTIPDDVLRPPPGYGHPERSDEDDEYDDAQRARAAGVGPSDAGVCRKRIEYRERPPEGLVPDDSSGT